MLHFVPLFTFWFLVGGAMIATHAKHVMYVVTAWLIVSKRPIQLASLGKISSLGPSVSFLGLACFLLVFSVGSY